MIYCRNRELKNGKSLPKFEIEIRLQNRKHTWMSLSFGEVWLFSFNFPGGKIARLHQITLEHILGKIHQDRPAKTLGSSVN